MMGTTMRGALVALLLLGVAACGGGSSETDTGSGEPTAGGDGFPVTVEHRYGETTVEAVPEKVVTVGLTDHDAVLALGVKPVGVVDWFGNHPHGVWPWAQDELGDAQPEIVGTAASLNFEDIAELEPDVILALYSGLTDADYETLSQIAPTIAQPDDVIDYGIAWDDQVLTVGRVLGKTAEAEAAVADVQQRFADVRAAHPEFDGATGLVASPYNDLVSVYAPSDPRGRFLAELGFVQPEEIADIAGDQFSADISFERVDLLEVDMIVWIVSSVETDKPEFDEQPLYAGLDVHQGGHEAFVENLGPLGGATSFVTVLSLPFLLDELVPQLATALAGTATP